eukprot:IDg21365t1
MEWNSGKKKRSSSALSEVFWEAVEAFSSSKGHLLDYSSELMREQTATYAEAISGKDGLVFCMYGPEVGRRHDMTLYRESGINTQLMPSLLIDEKQYCIYGDTVAGGSRVVLQGHEAALVFERF